MIPIEDNFEDVLGKAMSGLGLSLNDLAERAELPAATVSALLSGAFLDSAARRVTEVLKLDGDRLCGMENSSQVPSVELPDGVILHNAPFPIPGYKEMTVNSYSVSTRNDSESGFLIDAGASFDSLLDSVGQAAANGWKLMLTHTHVDHVIYLESLSRRISSVFSPASEHLADTIAVREGELFQAGQWQLTVIETPGHSSGGTSYLLRGGETPILFVGDALFCYSIGKVPEEKYEAALKIIRKKILSLPENTILCPGHGPLTTVGFEKKHNPFFTF